MSKEETREAKTAIDMAKELRSVSVSEFFERNRHLLGYDNPLKALLTVIKEGVDNSCDACEEARILPEVIVEVKELGEDRFKIIIEDNGPGIVKEHIPNVFGKLLYGSKFHRLRQSRGIQGIGISAAVLYSQLTTGKAAKIISKIASKKKAALYELFIDIQKNESQIIKEEDIDWTKDHGTRIELEIEGKYQKGYQSVDQYLKQTAIVNPHLQIIYHSPKNEKFEFMRATNQLPKEPREIKPHPYGIELGILIRMLNITKARTLGSFLMQEFSRVGPSVAKEVCEKAKLQIGSKPIGVVREAESLLKAIRTTKIIAPPTDCLSPITSELLETGLKKEVNAEFYCSTTRPATVYRGNPFVIECSIAYGGELPKDEQVRILRFANRVPLLYQKGSCAITDAITKTNWRQYGLQQSANNIPIGPACIVVHIASVWVPFTSESKEAIAHYPEIQKEIKLALQECGRKLSIYIHKHIRAQEQKEKANLFEKYIPEVASALEKLSGKKKELITENLKRLLKKNLPLLIEEDKDIIKAKITEQDTKDLKSKNKKLSDFKK